MLEVAVDGSLNKSRLDELVNRIVTALENGDEVLVRNATDNTTTTITALELAKQRLDEQNYAVTQRNALKYKPEYTAGSVLAAENKRKIHHYTLNFESVLRAWVKSTPRK